MRWLITGGAGFIGSNFIFYLLDRYPRDQVICLDKLTYAANIETLAPLRSEKRFTFIAGDIANKKAVESAFNEHKPDVVVNFAAESHVDRSIKKPSVFLRSNTFGVQVLLDACLKFGIPRFHQISTDEVYGDFAKGEEGYFTEKSNLKPSSPYSASKAAADLLCGAYFRTYGLYVTVSRCANNYGAYQFPEKLIPLTILNALSDRPVPVYGDGQNVRDWLHVSDHCAAIDLIVQKGEKGGIYNIGGNCEYKNIDVVKMILAELGKSENLIRFTKDRKGHDFRYGLDATLLRKKWGWHPQVDFQQGLARTVRWYLENERWWRAILNKSYQKRNEQVKVNILK